jgi:hypothetical protein
MFHAATHDEGYFHLTPHGWVRQDNQPFPDDRVETWRYEMDCPAEDAKDQVCLTRVWFAPGTVEKARDALRSSFGQPLMATPERNVTLECLI